MPKAFLEITLNIKPENRATAAGVYTKYKETFLNEIMGAKSKDLFFGKEKISTEVISVDNNYKTYIFHYFHFSIFFNSSNYKF